jgi:DNA-binding protein Fis
MERGRAASALPAFADQLFVQRPGRVYREAVAALEEALLAHALALTGGNQLRAARLLGLNRNTLHKRCRQLGVLPKRSRRPVDSPSAARDHDLPTVESAAGGLQGQGRRAEPPHLKAGLHRQDPARRPVRGGGTFDTVGGQRVWLTGKQ